MFKDIKLKQVIIGTAIAIVGWGLTVAAIVWACMTPVYRVKDDGWHLNIGSASNLIVSSNTIVNLTNDFGDKWFQEIPVMTNISITGLDLEGSFTDGSQFRFLVSTTVRSNLINGLKEKE